MCGESEGGREREGGERGGERGGGERGWRERGQYVWVRTNVFGLWGEKGMGREEVWKEGRVWGQLVRHPGNSREKH